MGWLSPVESKPGALRVVKRCHEYGVISADAVSNPANRAAMASRSALR